MEASEQFEVLGAVAAHQEAMSLPVELVVRKLVDLLGATTVAVIGDVKETRAVQQWARGRAPQREHALRFALQIASMIATASGSEMAKAWFHGANPVLDDEVPMLLLRDQPLNEIQGRLLTAARSFAARGETAPQEISQA